MAPFDSGDDVIVPQANSLPVLCSVVDAIMDGSMTSAEIGVAVGMSGRQGSYYPHAARLLDLVEPCVGTSPLEWGLTLTGAAFVRLDAVGRVVELCELLSQLDVVQVFVDQGAEGLRALWEDETELSEATISRRIATVSTWTNFLLCTGTGDQVRAVGMAMDDTRVRAPGVRAARVVTRVPARAVVRCRTCNAEILGEVAECELCF